MIIRNAKRRQLMARMTQSRLWLAPLLGLSLLFLPFVSHAKDKEKILLLSVLKEGKPDARLLRVAQDRMVKAGEQLIPSSDLSNSERKCMQQECLMALAATKGSDLVLAGTVQKVKGGGQSLGVLLYDFSKMKASELSSDCERCTPDLLSQRLSELFARALVEFRGAPSATQAPAIAKNDKPPIAIGLGKEQAKQTVTQAPAEGALKQPWPTAQAPQAPIEEPLAVVTGGPLPTQAKPVEPVQKPSPAIELVQKPQPAVTASHGLQLSPKRKILAGVLGGLALGSLIGAVALTATDGNVTSMDCSASPGVNKICVLDNKIPSSVGYVMAGAFTVGTVLTLLWPESKPQPKESASAEAAK